MMIPRKIVAIAIAVLIAAPAFADSLSTTLNDNKLDYPELEVTPLASVRLKMEAEKELHNTWQLHIPAQISALLTLTAAATAQPKSSYTTSTQRASFETAKGVAIGVGIGWLAVTAGLSAWYRPYLSGFREISRLPAKTERQKLTRERLAEEALYAPEDLAIKIKWFSFVSNLAANIAVMSNADRNSQGFLAAAAFASLAPILFPYRWETVAERHRLYLKRIYGPVASAVLLPTVSSSGSMARYSTPKYSPGVELQWTF